jgi:hypothetical protein
MLIETSSLISYSGRIEMKKLTSLGLLLNFTLIFSAHAANPISQAYVDQQIQNVQAQITTVQAQVAASSGGSSSSLSIGQLYQGGVIFWLDPTSSQHGLAAAITDLTSGAGVNWDTDCVIGMYGSVTCTATSAFGDAAYAGISNTQKMRSTTGVSSPAASACVNYSYGGYSDWYLPSSSELILLLANKMTINMTSLNTAGGSALADAAGDNHNSSTTTTTSYWSSTETTNPNGAYTSTSSGSFSNLPKNSSAAVRCIRKF